MQPRVRSLVLRPSTLAARGLALAGLLLAAAFNVPAIAAPAPFGDRFFDPSLDPRVPEQLAWSPDGKTLGYVWNDGRGDGLWLLDMAGDAGRRLLPLSSDAVPGNLDAWRWMPDGKSLLLTAGGDLFQVQVADAQVRRLTTTEAAEEDAKPSPDGRHMAFVRGGNLYLLDLASGAERALTTDGDDQHILNGKTDWLYWEELWGRSSTGFWWSPDSRRIAFYRFDESAVPRYPLVNFLPVYPEVAWQSYPKAGQANPTVRVGVLGLEGGEVTWLSTGEPMDDYLARVHWLPGGQEVAVERLNREQNRLDLLRCAAGDGSCRTLLTESDPTWVNVGDDTTFLAGGGFIWGSERSGWRQLYLYRGDGTLERQLTQGEGAVTSLDTVDEDAGWLVYTTYQPGFLGVAGRRVMRQPLAGGEPQVLTPGSGWNGATVGAGGAFVHSWSDADHPDHLVVRNGDGSLHAELPSSPGTGFDPAALPSWRFFTLPGPNGVELPARMLLPAGFDPQKRYPAVIYHYGGPESQVVKDQWDGGRRRDIWHKWMAQRGYVVLMVDNEASLFFGRAGANRVYRRFGPLNLAAQLAAVDYLKGLGYVDPARLGLWGWSGGGFHTLYCVLQKPGVWRAAVAGAPVTDWHLYDSIWTERYLDHPDDNAEGYRLSSPVTYAANLRDALLLIHGTADDNVHMQNTIQFSQKLIEADLPFEEAIYPRQKHSFKAQVFKHFLERMAAFFDRQLQP